MKIVQSMLLIVLVISMLACSSGGTDQVAETNKEIKKMEISTSKAGSQEQSTSYPITNTSAGEFHPGAVIPLWEGAETAYTLTKRIEKKQQEGETVEEVQYKASIDGEHHLTLIPHFDIRVEEYNEIVSEVIVHSPKYKDAKGIHVGSTVADFKKAYPDAKCYVTYVSSRCWLASGDNGPQFDIVAPKTIPDDFDLVEMDLSEVDQNEKIRSIRIYQSGNE